MSASLFLLCEGPHGGKSILNGKIFFSKKSHSKKFSFLKKKSFKKIFFSKHPAPANVHLTAYGPPGKKFGHP